MPFKKGKKKTGGRQQGVQNKLTKTVKEIILEVCNELQNDPKANMLEWARNNPKDFYLIAAKLIPTEVNTTTNIPPLGGADLEMYYKNIARKAKAKYK